VFAWRFGTTQPMRCLLFSLRRGTLTATSQLSLSTSRKSARQVSDMCPNYCALILGHKSANLVHCGSKPCSAFLQALVPGILGVSLGRMCGRAGEHTLNCIIFLSVYSFVTSGLCITASVVYIVMSHDVLPVLLECGVSLAAMS